MVIHITNTSSIQTKISDQIRPTKGQCPLEGGLPYSRLLAHHSRNQKSNHRQSSEKLSISIQRTKTSFPKKLDENES